MKEKTKVNESKHTFVLLTWKQAWKLTNVNVFIPRYYLDNGGAKKESNEERRSRRKEEGGKKEIIYFGKNDFSIVLYLDKSNRVFTFAYFRDNSVIWYLLVFNQLKYSIQSVTFKQSIKKKYFVKTMETPASAQKRPRLGML